MAAPSATARRAGRPKAPGYVHLGDEDRKEYPEITIGATPLASECLLGPLTAWPDGTYFFEHWPTRLEHPNWRDFRDPQRLWFRSFVAEMDGYTKDLADSWEAAQRSGSVEFVDPSWHEALRHLAALRFHEFGAAQVWQLAQTMTTAETVANCALEEAGARFFSAHALNRLSMELAEALPGWDDTDARDRWSADPVWKGAREYIEQEFLLRDWAEIVVADNLVGYRLYVEPLLRYFSITAAKHGDPVTPTLAGVMLAIGERNARWGQELVRVALQVGSNRGPLAE